ncbi:MAG: YigZ family protein [Chitinophagaceae bacterium]
MSLQHTYYTIDKVSEALFKDRGSKFLAYAYPIANKDDVKKRLQNLKNQHPKAVHFCYAYRLGIDKNDFRANDDGEPSGSAGKPILGQLDSFNLTNCLVVVVRYFGGTLLGVPGLIHAYKTSTQLALEQVAIIEKEIKVTYKFTLAYENMNIIMRVIKQFQAEIITQDMALFCTIQVDIPYLQHEKFLQTLLELQAMNTIELVD